MKRERNLFEKIIADDNLSLAIDEVNRSHHWHKGHQPNRCTAWVEYTKSERIKALKKIITDGFEPHEPHVSKRWDVSARKWRGISEPLQWPDQYVHHALIQVIQPVMMRGMDYYCCGSIRHRGPYQAKKAIESWMRTDPKGTRHEFCGDIKHFYDSLKPEVVLARMRQLIKDHKTLDLIERITRDGIKIGEYTSQWFANTTLQPMDVMIRQSGLCSHYVRYMDNITVFGSNKRNIRKLKTQIEEWLNNHGLRLKEDWQIFPLNQDDKGARRLPDAVGYRYGRKYTLPRKHNLLRTKRAVARYRKRKNNGKRISPRLASSVISRLGQIKHCSNVHLYKELYQGERVVKDLKQVVRKSQKEVLDWNTFMEQYSEKAQKKNASK